MVRNWSYLKNTYYKKNNYIWYSRIVLFGNLTQKIQYTTGHNFHWYDKSVNVSHYAYRMFRKDRFFYQYKSWSSFFTTKQITTNAHYKTPPLLYWRRIKYTIFYNSIFIMNEFIHYLYKSISFKKNEIVLFSSSYTFIVDNIFHELYTNYTASFFLNKRFWFYFFQKNWTNHMYSLTFKCSKALLFSLFVPISVLNVDIRPDLEVLTKLNLREFSIYSGFNHSSLIYNDLLDSTYVDLTFLMNDFEYDHILSYNIELYKICILLFLFK